MYIPPPLTTAARYWPVLSDAIDCQSSEGAEVFVQLRPIISDDNDEDYDDDEDYDAVGDMIVMIMIVVGGNNNKL